MSSRSRAVAAQMAEVVGELLETLTADQHESATWPFPSDDERMLWFYTPTDHGGLPLTQMSSPQHQLVHKLLAVALSEGGYNTAAIILGQENILDRADGFSASFGRDRGRDPLLYWIAVFGQPGFGTWGWRFGGHHISVHFTIANGRVVSSTPCFMGVDPASVPLLGPHLHRPLGAVEDIGRELVQSLNSSQLSVAVGSPAAPADLVGSNRTNLSDGDEALPLPLIWRGRFEAQMDDALNRMQEDTNTALGITAELSKAIAFTAQPKGLAAGEMTAGQRDNLKALLSTYVGRINDDLADDEMAKVNSAFDDLHFLWAGGTEVGVPHYYRVQGDDFMAEYDNAQRQGNHVHTVWRDLSNDFGGDPLAQHYTEAGHPH